VAIVAGIATAVTLRLHPSAGQALTSELAAGREPEPAAREPELEPEPAER